MFLPRCGPCVEKRKEKRSTCAGGGNRSRTASLKAAEYGQAAVKGGHQVGEVQPRRGADTDGIKRFREEPCQLEKTAHTFAPSS